MSFGSDLRASGSVDVGLRLDAVLDENGEMDESGRITASRLSGLAVDSASASKICWPKRRLET